MERIGRILDWRDGVATVEISFGGDGCVTGNCSECHAAAGDAWVFTTPMEHSRRAGERVLVKERAMTFRALCWLGFLAGFCALLAGGEALLEAARSEGSAAQRVLVIAALGAGVAGWLCARAWTKRLPRFRVSPLADRRPPAAVRPRAAFERRAAFVAVDDVRRIER